ncbi:MAG: hypothetical protein Q7T39_11105 [Polaromonas sp.]|mgnify:CR=1 FL=1|nr:hypothetical protein [Polaromonas sp.]
MLFHSLPGCIKVRPLITPLFRYFSEENARTFIERGEVLMHSLSYFRDYEDEGVRADAFEGTLAHRPVEGLRLRMKSTGEQIAVPHTFEATAKEDQIFVYCLSTKLSATLAERFQTPVAVEILEPLQFLAKLRTALGLRPRMRADQLVHGSVRYYDWDEPPIVDWALPERISLRKPRHFDWQHEYRFAVPVGDAFAIENVQTKLVPLSNPRPARSQSHPKVLLRLGNLNRLCRVHRP